MNLDQSAHQIGLARAGKAALRRDTEFRHVFASEFDAFLRALEAIRLMYDT